MGARGVRVGGGLLWRGRVGGRPSRWLAGCPAAPCRRTGGGGPPFRRTGGPRRQPGRASAPGSCGRYGAGRLAQNRSRSPPTAAPATRPATPRTGLSPIGRVMRTWWTSPWPIGRRRRRRQAAQATPLRGRRRAWRPSPPPPAGGLARALRRCRLGRLAPATTPPASAPTKPWSASWSEAFLFFLGAGAGPSLTTI